MKIIKTYSDFKKLLRILLLISSHWQIHRNESQNNKLLTFHGMFICIWCMQRIKLTSFAHILHYTKYNTFFFRIRNLVQCLPSSLCVAMQLQLRKATFQAQAFCITLFSTLTVPSDGQGTRCSSNLSGQLNIWTRTYKITIVEGVKTIRRTCWQFDCDTGCSSKTKSCYCSLSQFVKHETNEVVQNSALSKQNTWLDCKR